METNTLVTHKKNKFSGIGCVSKVLKNYAVVNIGTDSTMKCTFDTLAIVNVNNCKPITMRQYTNRILDDNGTINDCIVGNELMHFVGIGWTTTRVVTEDDLKKYPRVV